MPIPWKFFFAIVFFTLAAGFAMYLLSLLRRDKAERNGNQNEMTGGRLHVPGHVPNKNIARVRVFMIISAVLAFFLFALSCFTAVPTKEIGIKTNFGRPTGSLPNGPHPKFPWQKVTKIDGAIQTDSYVAEGKDGADGKCTDIRIGNESTACVDNSVRWRILPGQGDELFRDYRGFANIRDSLVTREKNAALNDVLGGYNPSTPSTRTT